MPVLETVTSYGIMSPVLGMPFAPVARSPLISAEGSSKARQCPSNAGETKRIQHPMCTHSMTVITRRKKGHCKFCRHGENMLAIEV